MPRDIVLAVALAEAPVDVDLEDGRTLILTLTSGELRHICLPIALSKSIDEDDLSLVFDRGTSTLTVTVQNAVQDEPTAENPVPFASPPAADLDNSHLEKERSHADEAELELRIEAEWTRARRHTPYLGGEEEEAEEDEDEEECTRYSELLQAAATNGNGFRFGSPL